jgi:hypothetical protein
MDAMTSTDDPLLNARARVLHDMEVTGIADATTVSVLEEAVTSRRWWAAQWEQGVAYAAGLVAQDVQDELLSSHGRWPVCPSCEGATHALYIHPELGGPDPVWLCEQTGQEVAPLGELSSTRPTGPPEQHRG